MLGFGFLGFKIFKFRVYSIYGLVFSDLWFNVFGLGFRLFGFRVYGF